MDNHHWEKYKVQIKLFKSKKEDILQLYIKLCVLFNLNLQYL